MRTFLLITLLTGSSVLVAGECSVERIKQVWGKPLSLEEFNICVADLPDSAPLELREDELINREGSRGLCEFFANITNPSDHESAKAVCDDNYPLIRFVPLEDDFAPIRGKTIQ